MQQAKPKPNNIKLNVQRTRNETHLKNKLTKQKRTKQHKTYKHNNYKRYHKFTHTKHITQNKCVSKLRTSKHMQQQNDPKQKKRNYERIYVKKTKR